MTMPIPSALWSAHHKTHQYRLNLVRDYRHWAETKQRLLQRWEEIKLGVLGKKLSLRHGGSEIHYFLWVTSQRSLSTRNIQAAVAENIIKWGASLPVVAQSMEDKWETRWLACLLTLWSPRKCRKVITAQRRGDALPQYLSSGKQMNSEWQGVQRRWGSVPALPLRAGSCLQLHTTVSPTETWQNVNACMAASPTPAGHGDRILNPPSSHGLTTSRVRLLPPTAPPRPPPQCDGGRGDRGRTGVLDGLTLHKSPTSPGITQHVNMAKVTYLHLKVQLRCHNNIFQRIETVQILSERLKNAASKLIGIVV